MASIPVTEDDLVRVVDLLQSPAILTLNAVVVRVNRGWSELFGYSQSEVVGRSAIEFADRSEQHRFQERSPVTGKSHEHTLIPLQARAITKDGRKIEVFAAISYFPSSDPKATFALSLVTYQRSSQPELDVARTLVEISAAVVGEHSSAAIRKATLQGLARHGFRAAFLAEGDSATWSSEAPYPNEIRAEYIRDALLSHEPVFAGADTMPSHVYLPIMNPEGRECLVIHGSQIRGQQAGAFALFARMVSQAFASANLHATRAKELSEARSLLELARAVEATSNLTTILNVSTDYLVRVFDIAQCSIFLLDDSKKHLRGASATEPYRSKIERVILSVHGATAPALAVQRRAPVVIEDVRRVNTAPYAIANEPEPRALVALPIESSNEVLGVVVLSTTTGPRQFSASWLELAQATTGQIALAIRNARLVDSLKQSVTELADTRAEMLNKERLAGLGELSAVIAHEVRNPLGVIFNAVSSLKKLVSLRGDTGTLLEILSQESERLNRLIGDLLAFARPSKLLLGQEDLRTVILDAVTMVQRLFPREVEHIRFETHVPENLGTIPIDRSLVGQALVNVFTNSVQAMPTGGRVLCKAGHEPRDGKATIRIDVIDDGMGVSPAAAAKAFEPFFTTKARGTGLGLALVKRIAEEHHGAVQFASKEGSGSGLTIWLSLDTTHSETQTELYRG